MFGVGRVDWKERSLMRLSPYRKAVLKHQAKEGTWQNNPYGPRGLSQSVSPLSVADVTAGSSVEKMAEIYREIMAYQSSPSSAASSCSTPSTRPHVLLPPELPPSEVLPPALPSADREVMTEGRMIAVVRGLREKRMYQEVREAIQWWLQTGDLKWGVFPSMNFFQTICIEDPGAILAILPLAPVGRETTLFCNMAMKKILDVRGRDFRADPVRADMVMEIFNFLKEKGLTDCVSYLHAIQVCLHRPERELFRVKELFVLAESEGKVDEILVKYVIRFINNSEDCSMVQRLLETYSEPLFKSLETYSTLIENVHFHHQYGWCLSLFSQAREKVDCTNEKCCGLAIDAAIQVRDPVSILSILEYALDRGQYSQDFLNSVLSAIFDMRHFDGRDDFRRSVKEMILSIPNLRATWPVLYGRVVKFPPQDT